jgi:hypothetical protein
MLKLRSMHGILLEGWIGGQRNGSLTATVAVCLTAHFNTYSTCLSTLLVRASYLAQPHRQGTHGPRSRT